MSRCDEIRELLPLWAGGDLPDAEAAAVGTHLSECAECRTEAEAWRRDLERVVRGVIDGDGPGIETARIDEAVDHALAAGRGGQPAPTGRRGSWTRVWQVAAPLAAMLAVALVWRFVELPGTRDRSGEPSAPGLASWSELQEEFGGCLNEPVAPEELRGEAAAGLVVVLSPADGEAGYVVADCIEVRDLARLRRYPWLEQRLDAYRLTEDGEREIVLAACPAAGLDRAGRRGLRNRVLERFGGAG